MINMRFVHLSDIHIGKRVYEFSMIDDQKYILSQIVQIIAKSEVDAVFIAGDVYDKSLPSAEAVTVFDDFLTKLSRLGLHIFVISGNHDCAERLAFGAGIMENQNIHIAPAFTGSLKCVKLEDDYGKINIYMLPFIKPSGIRQYYNENEINDYTAAVKTVIDNEDIDVNERNILIAHQFVTGASRCDSNEVTVGGLDNVEADVFSMFDYVALGHIHGRQCVARESLRYCGSPLKYSFSEEKQEKYVTIVDMTDGIKMSEVVLKPLHNMRRIKGSYDELTYRENYISDKPDDYVYITLTDEEEIPDAIGKLRSIYPNIMRLDYDNTRTRENKEIRLVDKPENKSPLELFEEFYQMQNNRQMSEEQRNYIINLL